jgi:ADP-ribosylglycohydrolase
MDLPFAVYREKVLGCWLGKAVGGTLGGPYEGQDGPLKLTFYKPVPTEMLPNDDLDLQVVWLETIRRRGLPVDRRALADAWLQHLQCWPDEYGVACRNLTHGIYPPASGAFDNSFTAGMGSAIRSEIWACLAPGDPELAASLAREDACVDHADEGIDAEVFLTTLESAAFVETNVQKLLDLALAAIPDDSRVARAVADTRDWWAASLDWQQVRQEVLFKYGSANFTDVAQNLAFIVLGWLAGAPDFGAAICTAVNCGKDTDCTGATLGALLGILDPAGIPAKWLKPIGRDLVLSPCITGLTSASTLDGFTDRVTALALDVLDYYGSNVCLVDAYDPAAGEPALAPPRLATADAIALETNVAPNEALLTAEPLVVNLIYPRNIALTPGEMQDCQLAICNPTDDTAHVELYLRGPEAWALEYPVQPFNLAPGESTVVMLSVTPPPARAVRTCWNPLRLRFTVNGLPWSFVAGLPLTIPWRRWTLDEWPELRCPDLPANAGICEVPGHTQPLPEGVSAFATDVKIPARKTVRFIALAPRRTRVWLDYEPAFSHEGPPAVPAFHRCGATGKDIYLQAGWHRVTIAVDAGDQGDLFVGLGDGETWDWLRHVEWRLPREEEA